jgi:hypothetical protein
MAVRCLIDVRAGVNWLGQCGLGANDYSGSRVQLRKRGFKHQIYFGIVP